LSPLNPKPLTGVLVVDFSRHLPGPLAAHLLADLGARVVKVEEPEAGDPVRRAPPRRDGQGALAGLLLSGVESIALDLKQPAALEVARRLAGRADVLLESFRPGTLARLGLDPAALAAAHPRLILCSLSGWGQTGPWAGRSGHDLTYQATAGTLAGSAGSAGSPSTPAAPVADLIGAWSAVTAILAALVGRQRTGIGCRIDAALVDAAAHANLVAWAEEAGGARRVGEALPLSGALPCYGVYSTRDGGQLALAALEPHFFERFCVAAGKPDLAPLQYRRSRRAHARIAALVAGRTRAEWEELLKDADIPAAPVLSAAEARAHPQMRERGMLDEDTDGRLHLGFPALFNGDRPRAGTRMPALGEATEAILEELGMAAELAELPARKRRKAGIGVPFSWRRWLRSFWP
jgi:alpha-methylacyl-CoA racemase